MNKQILEQSTKQIKYGVPEGPVDSCFKRVLTNRELEICDLISKGHSSSQIAKYLYISEGTVKNHITSIYRKIEVKNRTQLAAKYVLEHERATTDMSASPSETISSLAENYQSLAKLRLIGDKSLPEIIPLVFNSQLFTIGRFDVSLGQKQCDFEFDRSTKAVSRKHAIIERLQYGYAIIDVNSRAGTFIKGKRIEPGKRYPIVCGDYVSFGNAGADYVFEC